MDIHPVDAELVAAPILHREGDPLSWWKQNEFRFPTLAKLARRILCIPATSAPSERLFSDAGLIIAKDRASMLPDMAATLIFFTGLMDTGGCHWQ